ncbi:hypothetical protein E1J38_014480 [Seonamhaeicola sediminis]|uniref:Right-handed parallel beta-helix repeat-containing protein n=1 Tax=Seonamhaeicola sediminis TaxID=2528206 RepID=A0A562Y8K9_9FLAO|nr:hypothetical protein [Seonamhaeicola sediminis]TWO30744.1 hypothetical protein E1J38_014480 [Seonamhaeicola sediminis]
MKYLSLIIAVLFFTLKINGQDTSHTAVISYDASKTSISLDKQGILHINLTPSDTSSLLNKSTLNYEDFGAVGNGKSDDIIAIAATHAFANAHNKQVKTKDSATYYISGKSHTVIIKTNTNFGKAAFIIDDTQVENRKTPVFLVSSKFEPIQIKSVSSLKKNQSKLDITLSQPSMITVVNSKVKNYIRKGINYVDKGASQTDVFVVNAKGHVDTSTPIIWDFNQITSAIAQPIDEDTLYIKGGRFTTIANSDLPRFNYYGRNLVVKRSNVTIDGLQHLVVSEGNQGAPYSGFIHIRSCAFVTVKNTLLTGHKTYKNGKNPIGTYDITVNRALNVSFINCSQTNDINNRSYWGIMASSYCKNIVLDNCTLSRFDAHKGVTNATLKNCNIGHMGLRIIGSGTFKVENTTVYSHHFISLREDYGSTWNGQIIIKDCVFKPLKKDLKQLELIAGTNTGQHNFGYPCFMPETIVINNLYIDDSQLTPTYRGPFIFKNFNYQYKSEVYKETYPYTKTKQVFLNEINIASKNTLKLSPNLFMFKGVAVIQNN